MPPATRQASARSLKHSSLLHRDPTSSRGLFPRNIRSPESTTTSATTPEIEGDIKLVTESADYDVTVITKFVKTVHRASPPSTNTPFVSTRGEDTMPLQNDVEEINMFVARLMRAMGEVIVPPAPAPPPVCFHEAAMSSPPSLRASNSPRLALETPPTIAPPIPHVSRKSTRIQKMTASAGIGRKTRLPLKTRDINTAPKSNLGLRPLRGAGGSIFIRRVEYKSSSAVPRDLLA
ncbi:hypothetical protein Q9L58_007579 [Maublancomyces gigas]|uniref:Uncharacterized protein n=1 Tax=Discina gigas TaxID=1032678 RepID=A0ABR3GC63_9PEZI